MTPPLQVLLAMLAAVALALLVFFTTSSSQGTKTPPVADPTPSTAPPPSTEPLPDAEPPPDAQAPPDAIPPLVTPGAQYFSNLPAEISGTQYASDSPAPADTGSMPPCVTDLYNGCPVFP